MNEEELAKRMKKILEWEFETVDKISKQTVAILSYQSIVEAFSEMDEKS